MVLNAFYGQDNKISDIQKSRLIEILGMKTEDSALLQEAIDILYQSGSIDYSEKFARNLLT